MLSASQTGIARRASAMFGVLCFLAASAGPAGAQEACYRVPVEELSFESEPAPGGLNVWNVRGAAVLVRPFVVLEGPGEAYLSSSDADPWRHRPEATSVQLCTPSEGEVRGTLWWPADKFGALAPHRFSIPIADAAPATRSDFLRARFEYHDRLAGADVAGAAWFAHRARESRTELEALGETISEERRVRWGGARRSDLVSTYALLSGRRALAENLRLEDELALASEEAPPVSVDEIEGVDLPPYDWGGVVQGLEPETDPLARLVPEDQHAVFFPDLTACLRVLAEVEANGLPVLQLLEGRQEDVRLRARYERQLCLDAALLAQMSGGAVLGEVAFTGSDPYLRMGSDVAVLIEGRRPELLERFIEGRAKAAAREPGVERVSGAIGELAYVGARSTDRRICSYSARIDNVVVVTNSLVQLERIHGVATGATQALLATEEYRFFRDRYPRDTPGQTAFAVLSDPAIRRWCGPRWRIGTSRRARAAAQLARRSSEHVEGLVLGSAEPADLGPLAAPLGGTVRIDGDGLRSDEYGRLGFMTPIVELELDEVSEAERAAYRVFRGRFEREASGWFDPIGASVVLADETVELDLSVFPLMGRSEYNDWLDFVRGGELRPDAGDPHAEAILQLVFAIHREGRAFQRLDESARIVPVPGASPLGWVGHDFSFYLDAGEEWDALDAEGFDGFFDEPRSLPVALSIDVQSPLQLAGFLAAVRSFLEQVAPGIVEYQTVPYREKAYVRVSPTDGEDIEVWYAALADELVFSFSEKLIQRAIDRRVDASEEATPAAGEWLGSEVALRVDPRGVALLKRLFRDELVGRVEAVSWSNLPILNEWQRLFPEQNPVEVHERLFGARLVCPGGGEYLVDPGDGLVRSPTYGHPGARQEAAPPARPLTELRSVDGGLSFENDGVRARVRLGRER